MRPRITRLEWVQSLRGLAALMVLLFHAAPHLQASTLLAPYTDLVRWCFSGVDIFFVLSGFVVHRAGKAAILEHRTLAFVRHRLVRVYVGYWPALLLFAFVWLVLLDRDLPPPATIIGSSLLVYHNFVDNWLKPAWTLTYELCFYAWIVGLVLLYPRRPVISISVAMTGLIAWNAGWWLLYPLTVWSANQPLKYLLTPFGIEFLAGSLIAEVFERVEKKGLPVTPSSLVLAAALAIGGVGVGSQTPITTNIEIVRVATFGLGAAGVLALGLILERSSARPPLWLVKVGDASYGLYLLHTFLLELGSLGRMHLDYHASEALTVSYLLLVPTLIVALSLFWYKFVERPLLQAALKRFG